MKLFFLCTQQKLLRCCRDAIYGVSFYGVSFLAKKRDKSASLPILQFFSCEGLFFILLFFPAILMANTQLMRNPFLPVNTQEVIAQIAKPKIHSHWIPLYFAKADQVAAFINSPNNTLLSALGKIKSDARSNQIWVQDDAVHIKQIQEAVTHLDQPGAQFLIRAKIINLDRQYQRALGALFQTETPTTNSIAPLSLSEPDENTGAGQFTITLAKLSGGHLLDMQISALEQEGHATLISNPSLTTLNNQPAVIESGAEVPYQESTSSGATSVSFKKAVLKLKVTPTQLPHHQILLRLSLNQDRVSALTVKGVPAIETEQITTQVIVHNNQTVVLGGILETSHAHQNTGIPVVDHIPIVGVLFQHRALQTKQEELLIFITPSMIKSAIIRA